MLKQIKSKSVSNTSPRKRTVNLQLWTQHNVLTSRLRQVSNCQRDIQQEFKDFISQRHKTSPRFHLQFARELQWFIRWITSLHVSDLYSSSEALSVGSESSEWFRGQNRFLICCCVVNRPDVTLLRDWICSPSPESHLSRLQLIVLRNTSETNSHKSDPTLTAFKQS